MAGNQYKPDPRQSLFLTYYLDQKSETFSNALQSALKAGYEQEYAESITHQMPDWLSESLGKNNRLVKAEKVLDDCLEMNTVTKVIEIEGKEPIQVQDTQLVKIKQDTAKFIAERLGKDKGYSTRSELTGKDGKDLPTPLLQGVTNVSGDNRSEEAEPTN